MFSLETLIMVGAILFCAGGLVGAIISRSLAPAHGQRDLEERLKASRHELAQYQQDVAQHFIETSKLVNKLTQDYRNVHEHLAQGAMELTTAEISQKMLEAGERRTDPDSDDLVPDVTLEPPRDWAPVPGQTDTLGSEFGLNEVPEERGVEAMTVHQIPRRRATDKE